MPVFIALCRGEDIDNSHLLAVSTDRNLIRKVADLLVGTRCSIHPNTKQNEIKKMRKSMGMRREDVERLTFGAITKRRLAAIEQGASLHQTAKFGQTLCLVSFLPLLEFQVRNRRISSRSGRDRF